MNGKGGSRSGSRRSACLTCLLSSLSHMQVLLAWEVSVRCSRREDLEAASDGPLPSPQTTSRERGAICV
jgi:hypothetical protein